MTYRIFIVSILFFTPFYGVSPFLEYARTTLLRGNNPVHHALFHNDRIKNVLLGLIEAEKQSITIAIYSLTDADIAQALIEKQRQNVLVRVVMDHALAVDSSWTKARILVRHGIPVFLFPPNKNASAKMHNKFALFAKNLNDKRLVWTGSYNFSRAASYSNEENVVVLENNLVYQAYMLYFESLKRQAKLLHIS